jgi:signal peptidase I
VPTVSEVTIPDEGLQPDDADAVARDRGSRSRSTLRSALEWAAVIGGAVAVALLIKAFLLQAFFIPSPSMEQTLLENDRVLVNKLAGADTPGRGEVIVFEKPDADPTDEVQDLIKRVVGLPGETITLQDGSVYIDGRELIEPYLQPGVATLPGSGTLDPTTGEYDSCTVDDPCTVPDGHVFMMGDNRTNSQDSRYQQVGYVDVDTIVGRAFAVVWPLDRIGGL